MMVNTVTQIFTFSVFHRLDSVKIEGFMQSLKREVEVISQLTACMDAFNNSHTRLVVIADGLDSCEQHKLLHVSHPPDGIPTHSPVTSFAYFVSSFQVAILVHCGIFC